MPPRSEAIIPTYFVKGRPLPLELGLAIASQAPGMSGGLLFDMNLVVMRLDNPTKREIRDFTAPATVRVGDFGSFLLFSPKFRNFSFDLLWSPEIARLQDGQGMIDIPAGERLLLNFLLVDEKTVIQSIRTGTIGPNSSSFLARTQRALMGRDVDAEQIRRDMERLFSQHPRGIPDKAFQARSRIGA